MVYALIGVPLMLVCLSHLGSILAEALQSAYAYVCCCSSHKSERLEYQLEERGRSMRRMEVVGSGCGRAVCRLTSLESVFSDYPRGTTSHESDDDEIENSRGALNDTPSRVPLIWRGQGGGSDVSGRAPTPPPPRHVKKPMRPPFPPVLAASFLLVYMCGGAWALSSWAGHPYLEGLYFTFTALSTVGLGNMVPGRGSAPPSKNTPPDPQLHLLALSLYILVGLVLVATAFALVQEQVLNKTRQLAITLGVVKREELPL